MNETRKETGGAGPSHRGAEIGVAVAMAILALIGIYGSLQGRHRLGRRRPAGGFLSILCQPDRSDLLRGECRRRSCRVRMTASCSRSGGRSARSWLCVVPTAIYVALIPFLGIYVASALLIAVFMKWFGNYNWLLVLRSRSVSSSVLTFLMFEIWFLVPLPKGPLENLLGTELGCRRMRWRRVKRLANVRRYRQSVPRLRGGACSRSTSC